MDTRSFLRVFFTRVEIWVHFFFTDFFMRVEGVDTPFFYTIFFMRVEGVGTRLVASMLRIALLQCAESFPSVL